MPSITNQATGDSIPSIPDFFKRLSTGYPRHTGDSTYKFIEQVLQQLQSSVTSSSIVHDNACGPGTAATAIISHIGSEPSLIEATDSSPGMIDALLKTISTEHWENLRASIMDSHELTFPDSTFTTSITNFSIANFQNPLKCLQEVRRTLKPDGLAIVATWKRFTVANLVHTAQQAVRPDAQLMKVPGAQFLMEGNLRDLVVKAGFPSEGVQAWNISTTLQGEAIAGLREFMLGDFTVSARAGWTDEEEAKWEGAIDSAMEEEKTKNGGIKMEAWIITAVK